MPSFLGISQIVPSRALPVEFGNTAVDVGMLGVEPVHPPLAHLEDTSSSADNSLVAQVVSKFADRVWMRLCALRGHDDLTVYAEGRLYLRCQSCGRETPGWNV